MADCAEWIPGTDPFGFFYFRHLCKKKPRREPGQGRRTLEEQSPMPQSYDSTIFKAGEIKVRETKRGLEFHSFNWQRQRVVHIGTIKGQTYEKQAEILRQPEPSFCLTQSEFGALVDCGAGFIRIIPGDKSRTYSISVQDFKRYATDFHNSGYGPQWRVKLERFSSSSRVAPRNPIVDSPVREIQGSLW